MGTYSSIFGQLNRNFEWAYVSRFIALVFFIFGFIYGVWLLFTRKGDNVVVKDEGQTASVPVDVKPGMSFPVILSASSTSLLAFAVIYIISALLYPGVNSFIPVLISIFLIAGTLSTVLASYLGIVRGRQQVSPSSANYLSILILAPCLWGGLSLWYYISPMFGGSVRVDMIGDLYVYLGVGIGTILYVTFIAFVFFQERKTGTISLSVGLLGRDISKHRVLRFGIYALTIMFLFSRSMIISSAVHQGQSNSNVSKESAQKIDEMPLGTTKADFIKLCDEIISGGLYPEEGPRAHTRCDYRILTKDTFIKYALSQASIHPPEYYYALETAYALSRAEGVCGEEFSILFISEHDPVIHSTEDWMTFWGRGNKKFDETNHDPEYGWSTRLLFANDKLVLSNGLFGSSKLDLAHFVPKQSGLIDICGMGFGINDYAGLLSINDSGPFISFHEGVGAWNESSFSRIRTMFQGDSNAQMFLKNMGLF